MSDLRRAFDLLLAPVEATAELAIFLIIKNADPSLSDEKALIKLDEVLKERFPFFLERVQNRIRQKSERQ